MKLKTLSKINIYSRYINQLIMKTTNIFDKIVIFGLAIFLIYLPILITDPDSDSFLFFIVSTLSIFIMLLFLFNIILFICGLLLDYFLINWTYKKINLDVSDFNKMMLMNIVNKKYKFNKLNLELSKLEKSFTNKSTIYNELNNEDFPYINKFLRKMVELDKKKTEPSNFDEAETDKQDVSINTRNLEKLQLRLSESPKLLTLDSVDNELNNLIFHQMNAVKQKKKFNKINWN